MKLGVRSTQPWKPEVHDSCKKFQGHPAGSTAQERPANHHVQGQVGLLVTKSDTAHPANTLGDCQQGLPEVSVGVGAGAGQGTRQSCWQSDLVPAG